MDDQTLAPTEGTDEDALWLGVALLVGGTIVYLVGGRALDFISFGTKEPATYYELGGVPFMTYIWLGLMIGGAIGYRNREDRTTRGAVWRYRAAVWLGTIYSVSFSLNLAGWWFQPAVAIKYYWADIAKHHGLRVNANLLTTEDFKPLADSITYHWWGSAVIFVGLVMLALGVWVIWLYRREQLGLLAES